MWQYWWQHQSNYSGSWRHDNCHHLSSITWSLVTSIEQFERIYIVDTTLDPEWSLYSKNLWIYLVKLILLILTPFRDAVKDPSYSVTLSLKVGEGQDQIIHNFRRCQNSDIIVSVLVRSTYNVFFYLLSERCSKLQLLSSQLSRVNTKHQENVRQGGTTQVWHDQSSELVEFIANKC